MSTTATENREQKTANAKPASLTREQILALKNPAPIPFDTQEWGRVYIKRFTTAEIAGWREFVAAQFENGKMRDPSLYRAKLVQLSVCKENGELLFTPDDTFTLIGHQGSVIEEIFVASTRVNKLSEDATEASRTDFFATRKT